MRAVWSASHGHSRRSSAVRLWSSPSACWRLNRSRSCPRRATCPGVRSRTRTRSCPRTLLEVLEPPCDSRRSASGRRACRGFSSARLREGGLPELSGPSAWMMCQPKRVLTGSESSLTLSASAVFSNCGTVSPLRMVSSPPTSFEESVECLFASTAKSAPSISWPWMLSASVFDATGCDARGATAAACRAQGGPCNTR